MPVLVNKTQKNFTMISNNILRDKELCLKDRGLLCTLCSLPDKWNFSIAGLCAIVPDGKESITNSLNRLEQLGWRLKEKQLKDVRLTGRSVSVTPCESRSKRWQLSSQKRLQRRRGHSMSELQNLEELLSLMQDQEQMIGLMENLQNENEKLEKELASCREKLSQKMKELAETAALNESLNNENQKLMQQIASWNGLLS